MCLFECGATGRYYKSYKLGVIKKNNNNNDNISRAAERHNTQDKATVGAVSDTLCLPVVY